MKREDKLSGKNGFVLSPHTRKVKATEITAKLMLWIAAGITMGALFIIVGYILFRGFVSDLRIQYEVTPRGSNVLVSDESNDQGIVVIVNRDIRIRDITVSELADVFNGETDNWGSISEQDIDVKVFAQEGRVKDLFEKAVLSDVSEYAEGTVFLNDDRQVIEQVSKNRGAIGFISQTNAEYIEGTRSKPLEVRRISLAVNAEVTRAQDGKRINYLTEEQIMDIFQGKSSNWSEFGGADLPILKAVFSENTPIRAEFQEIFSTNGPIQIDEAEIVETPSELNIFLKENPGAIGFVYYNDAVNLDLEIVSIERRELEINLDHAFILEEPRRAGRVGGISTIILNTLFMIFLTILFAGPIGVAAAVYLTEYARQSRINEILRFGTETLAGIPSIIFGLFGFIVFVMYLDFGAGLLSGTLTVTFMILPTIIRASEEAIKSVPQTLRESSLALGATKLQTVTRVVIPAAVPGIMTGLILAIGRAVGETAALLFTMGANYELAEGFFSSARVMSVHLYMLVREGISFERAFATGTILILIILIINFATNKLIGRMARMHG